MARSVSHLLRSGAKLRLHQWLQTASAKPVTSALSVHLMRLPTRELHRGRCRPRCSLCKCDARAGCTPNHSRAKLVILTRKGKAAYEAATALQLPWVNTLSEGLKAQELAAARAILETLRTRLE
jgi:hypothetical protein